MKSNKTSNRVGCGMKYEANETSNGVVCGIKCEVKDTSFRSAHCMNYNENRVASASTRKTIWRSKGPAVGHLRSIQVDI